MDIKDILDGLGLDLTNPEVKRGAIEAIEAILASRNTNIADELGSIQGELDVEIDPDLLQPSIKNNNAAMEDEPEVDDEENLLDQVKHNENDDDDYSGEYTQDSTGEDENSTTSSDEEPGVSDNSETSDAADSDEQSNEDEQSSADGQSAGGGDDSDTDDSDSNAAKAEQDSEDETTDSDLTSSDEDDSNADYNDTNELDADDILDADMQNTYKDADLAAKENARRIKRERTISAAKNALDKARARKANNSLIRELERALAELESLQEAANKKLADLSDDEFNLIINRVFDAIDALGDSDLTYSSDEERQLRAKEIKADLDNKQTQAELSAEDVAQIRAETQAIKAREKELTKNAPRSRDSFKGFQDFLNSLYRAVALQVKINEVQDDSWSTINRRYSGTGVLQPGKKIAELPDGKIPVIDFYFDCSGSWDERDVAVGKKAVDLLAEMEEDGKIKINLYYFANKVHSDMGSARLEGGTWAWNEIIKNIVVTNATNVIIMTDSDMEDWWNGPTALKHTVPGYVWYLWRDGDNAPRLPRDLKGRGGTQQFSFSRGDL